MINVGFLAEQGPCKSYVAGELVLYPGLKSVEPKYIYILLSGAVDVFSKNEAGEVKKVASIIPGDVFGGREYFLGTYDLTYRAVENVNVYLLSEESFNELSWSQPGILFEILRSAYTPPRAPASDGPAPVKTIPAQKPLAAAVTAAAAGLSSNIYPPGHKVYTKKFPMNDKLVYAKDYTCPFCRKPFNDFKIFSTKLSEILPMRYDMRRFFTDFNAEWYDIITCSKCYFSMFSNYFTEPKPIRKEAIEAKLVSARSDVAIDFAAPRNINTVFTMHYLALLCCDGYPTLNTQLRAKVWGNLSWLYEDVEDSEMEKMAASKAADFYEELYNQKRLTPAQEQVTCISISSMQHREGVDNNLKKFLYEAKTNKMGDKKYAELAERCWDELNLGDDSEFQT